MKKAELLETIISYALSDNTKVMIRFQLQPYRDVTGQSYRPLLRGLCYVHPTKDTGMGDGKYAKELQIGIDDTFNISNDRVMLATLPTLKGRKYSLEDNSTVFFEPEHTIELENPDDLVEFKISDNIAGAINQISMLTSGMDKVMGIYPPAMGKLPEMASTTATAFAGTQASSNTRLNYKSLTFEHTFLTELHWIILQMTAQFAQAETGFKLMGNKLYDFDANADYVYKPLSQSIELEHSKAMKRNEIIQLINGLVRVPNPKTAMLVNRLMAKFFELAGDEYVSFADALLDERVSVASQAGTPEGGGSTPPTSNQRRLPMTGMEEFARRGAER